MSATPTTTRADFTADEGAVRAALSSVERPAAAVAPSRRR